MLRDTTLGYGPEDAYRVDAGRSEVLGLQGARRCAMFPVDGWVS